MNKTATLIGALVVVAVAAGIVWLQWGEHVELRGRVLDARAHGPAENDSVLVVDAELTNPADVPFEVAETEALVQPAQGEPATGSTVAAVDAQRVMEAFPLLKGSSEMPLLKLHDVIAPRQTVRRRFAFQFAGLGVKDLTARKSLTVKIQERLGAVAELK